MPPVHRFLQSVDEDDYKVLKELARQRKMSVQNFLRYVVLPEGLEMLEHKRKNLKLAKKELAQLKVEA